jgi:peroxiredoxin family protein
MESEAATLEQLNARVAALESPPKKMTIVVMSGDMDKLFGAFIIANGGAAMGMDVVMFFTFWGLRALKKADAKHGKSFFGRMLGMGAFEGGGIEKANPSHYSFGGIGRWMFGKMMRAHNVQSLPELRDLLEPDKHRRVAVEMGGDEEDSGIIGEERLFYS